LIEFPLRQVGQLLPLDPVQQTVRKHMTPYGPEVPVVQTEPALRPVLHPLDPNPWAVHPVAHLLDAVQPELQVAVKAWVPVLQVNPIPTGIRPGSPKSTSMGGS
jgi:hypothetical protein